MEAEPEPIVEEVYKPVEEPAPVIEEKKDKKKKKPKANKPTPSEQVGEVAPKVEVAVPPPIFAPAEEPKSAPIPALAPSGAAFDELGGN